MLPVYDLKNFADLDLRKYHIRDAKDVLRFIDFTMTRLEEVKHVVNKQSNRMNTLQAIVNQMRAQQEKISKMYGAPSATQEELKDKPATTEAVVQTTENDTDAAAREALLDDIRQAAANDTTAELEGDAKTAEFEKYKMTRGAYRDMYYREGTLVSAKDVPEDIKAVLEEAVGGPREPKKEDAKKEA